MSDDRRHRRKPTPGEFEDPLSNYDPVSYEDDLERSLAEDPATEIESRPFVAISANTSIRDAIAEMDEKNIAAMVITQNDIPVGILSERDILTRVAHRFSDIADEPVSRVMTADPVCICETDSPARALNLMSVGSFRHMPVVDVDGKLTGVIGARRITAYLQKHFGEITRV